MLDRSMKLSVQVISGVLLVSALFPLSAQAGSCTEAKMKRAIVAYVKAKTGTRSVSVDELSFTKTPGEAVVSFTKAQIDATCLATLILDTDRCQVLDYESGICVK